MTARQLLREAAGVHPTDREAILAALLTLDRTTLLAHDEEIVRPETARRYRALCERRRGGEPLAYLLGWQPFCGLDLVVNRHVLIPRPETAWLVEEARRVLRTNAPPRTVVDLGTGSGAVVLALWKLLPPHQRRRTRWYATDASAGALSVARRNARRQRATGIHFIRGDLLCPFKNLAADGSPLTAPVLLLANLPYLTTADYRRAPFSVKKFEPRDALLAGRDGLQHYRRLTAQLSEFKTAGFRCLWEIDPCHSRRLKALVEKSFPKSSPEILQDFNGRDRYLTFRANL